MIRVEKLVLMVGFFLPFLQIIREVFHLTTFSFIRDFQFYNFINNFVSFMVIGVCLRKIRFSIERKNSAVITYTTSSYVTS